jgi:hypothetical protein
MHDGRRTRHLSVPARQPRQAVKDMHMRAEEAWSGKKMFMRALLADVRLPQRYESMFRMVLPRSGECVVPEGLMGGQR